MTSRAEYEPITMKIRKFKPTTNNKACLIYIAIFPKKCTIIFPTSAHSEVLRRATHPVKRYDLNGCHPSLADLQSRLLARRVCLVKGMLQRCAPFSMETGVILEAKSYLSRQLQQR